MLNVLYVPVPVEVPMIVRVAAVGIVISGVIIYYTIRNGILPMPL